MFSARCAIVNLRVIEAICREAAKQQRQALQRAQRDGTRAAAALSKLEGAHSRQAAVLRRRSEHVAQLMRKLREAAKPPSSSASSSVAAAPKSVSLSSSSALTALLPRAPRGWDAAVRTAIVPSVLSVAESGGRILQRAVTAAGQAMAARHACGAMLASLSADATCLVAQARSKRMRDACIAHRTALAQEATNARDALRRLEAAQPEGRGEEASLYTARAKLAGAQERLDEAEAAAAVATEAAGELRAAAQRGATARLVGRGGAGEAALHWKAVLQAAAGGKGGAAAGEAVRAVEFLLEALGRAVAAAEALEEEAEAAAGRFEEERAALEERAGRDRTTALREQARAAEAAVEAEARVVAALRLGAASDIEGMPSDEEIAATLANETAELPTSNVAAASGTSAVMSSSAGLRLRVTAMSAELSRMAEVQDSLLEQRKAAELARTELAELREQISKLPAAARAVLESGEQHREKPETQPRARDEDEAEDDDEPSVVLLSDFESDLDEDDDEDDDDDSDWEGADAGGVPTVDKKRKTRPRTRRGAQSSSGSSVANDDAHGTDEEPLELLQGRIQARPKLGSAGASSKGPKPPGATASKSTALTRIPAAQADAASPRKPATKKEKTALRDIDGLLDDELTGRAKRQTALRRGKHLTASGTQHRPNAPSSAAIVAPASGLANTAVVGRLDPGLGSLGGRSSARPALGAMAANADFVSARPGKRVRAPISSHGGVATLARPGSKIAGALGLARAAVASASTAVASKRPKPTSSSSLR